MTAESPGRCPNCGGNLYLEPDVTEASPDLVCLQCARRYPSDRGPQGVAAGWALVRAKPPPP